jgi:hypothetical protein
MTTKTENTKIQVISKDHGKSGKRGQAFNSLLTCKTLASFRASLMKKGLEGYASWTVRTAKANGLIKLVA